MHIDSSIAKFRAGIVVVMQISAFVACIVAGKSTFAQTNYAKMSLNQKIGQLLIWPYPGKSLTPEIKALYEKYQPGALIAFGANITSTDQIGQVNSELQALAKAKMKAPLFLMIDQEGGAVTRLKTSVPLPSALALGTLDDDEFVHRFAAAKGALLRATGFNVNLAPVLDVADSTRDSFIGNRAFGSEPEKVRASAMAYADGIHDSGVMPTAKHFPGYGGLTQDTHRRLVKKMSTTEELSARDFIPFEENAQA